MQDILRTQCGVEMAELERALAQAGYRVTSWRTMADAMRGASQTAVAAARSFGAHVVFQVNSLERTQEQQRVVERTDWEFHLSDPMGTIGAPLAVQAGDARALSALANRNLAASSSGRGLAAMLDVVGIDVTSGGESVWFYRGRMAQPIDGDQGAQTFARGVLTGGAGSGATYQWAPFTPRTTGAADMPGTGLTTGGVTTREYGGGPVNEARAVEHQLMRDLIQDFVGRFRSGSEGT